jgi:D-alanyl-lipoteichoic acid acyltransferase DltB (MBOAT superfamily)
MTVELGDVDLFLVIGIVVAISFLLIIGFYMLVNYQHPDDKNDAYFPKAVVVFGFVLAGVTVLMLPLDVANNEGYAGTYKIHVDLYVIYNPTVSDRPISHNQRCLFVLSFLIDLSVKVVRDLIQQYVEGSTWTSCGLSSFG